MTIDFKAYENSDRESDFLFHYTTRKTAIRYILAHQQLKFSTRKKSHDPLEKDEIGFSVSSIASSDRDVVSNSLEKGLVFANRINKLRNSTKYACFSVDKGPAPKSPWNRGCFRSRMWSQYAESHRGVCLVFDRARLLSSVKKYLASFPGHFLLSGKIGYANRVQGMMETTHLAPGKPGGSPVDFLKKNAAYFLFTKIKDYEQEQEFRVVYSNSQRSPDLVSVDGAIAGVIVGQYCDDASFDELSQLAKSLRVPVATARWVQGRPFLETRA